MKMTIGKKLISLIVGLLVSSVVSLIWLATRLFIDDTTSFIQKVNADTAAQVATQVRQLLDSSIGVSRTLATIALREGIDQEGRGVLYQSALTGQDHILGIAVHKKNGAQYDPLLGLKIMEGSASTLPKDQLADQLKAMSELDLSVVAQGGVHIGYMPLTDSDSGDATVALLLSTPLIQEQSGGSTVTTHTLTSIIKQKSLNKLFEENDVVTTYLVNNKGLLFAHPDAQRAASFENISSSPIVQALVSGKFNNGQTRYIESATQTAKLGAYKLVGVAGLGIVTDIPEAKAFEASERVKYRSSLMGGVVLCLAFFIGYFFSYTIVARIRQLVDASVKIAKGDFKINLKPKEKDEIASLAVAFNEMAKGLAERDRVKETFNKFHSKEIADKLLSGKVQLGGEHLFATIFFSDVRGFTGMSERMKPQEVVEMLNEYMTAMVAVIRRYGGVVDKYVGDAIMALWGVPFGTGDDTYHAVLACLEMRVELANLNKIRMARGQVPLRIGMGLNCGPVIAGNIGSNEKMEYTVIGDAVNLASRIESSTKEFGTDFLVSKEVWEKVKTRVIGDQCATVQVKGKKAPLEFFRIAGFIDEKGQKIVIRTPYSSYEAEKSEKVVHAPKAKAA